MHPTTTLTPQASGARGEIQLGRWGQSQGGGLGQGGRLLGGGDRRMALAADVACAQRF